jgi:hypothetical protein
MFFISSLSGLHKAGGVAELLICDSIAQPIHHKGFAQMALMKIRTPLLNLCHKQTLILTMSGKSPLHHGNRLQANVNC